MKNLENEIMKMMAEFSQTLQRVDAIREDTLERCEINFQIGSKRSWETISNRERDTNPSINKDNDQSVWRHNLKCDPALLFVRYTWLSYIITDKSSSRHIDCSKPTSILIALVFAHSLTQMNPDE